MEVSGQVHAPAALPPGKNAGNHWTRGQVNPRGGPGSLGQKKIFCSYRPALRILHIFGTLTNAVSYICVCEEAPNMTSQVTTTPLLRSNFQCVSKSLQVCVCQMFLIHSFLLRHFTRFVSEENNALRSITDLMMTEQRTTKVVSNWHNAAFSSNA